MVSFQRCIQVQSARNSELKLNKTMYTIQYSEVVRSTWMGISSNNNSKITNTGTLDDIAEQWLQFQAELDKTEEINILRMLRCYSKSKLEHGFCDAPEKANGVIVYFPVVENGETYIIILHGQSNVAPIKQDFLHNY